MEEQQQHQQLPEVPKSTVDFEDRFKRIAISNPTRDQLLGDSAPLPVSGEFYRGRIPSMVLHKDLQNTLILKEVQNNPQFRTGVPVDQIGSRGVPRSSKEMTLNFSREEKLLLYDYCVKKTGHYSVADVPYSYMCGESTPADAGTSSSSSSTSSCPQNILAIAELEINRSQRKPETKRRPSQPLHRRNRSTYTDELRKLISTRMSAWEAHLREKSRRSRFKSSLKRLQ